LFSLQGVYYHYLFHSLFLCTDKPTSLISTLSLHDALPICEITINGNGATVQRSNAPGTPDFAILVDWKGNLTLDGVTIKGGFGRSEEHTSELQSRGHLVCRLLPDKKKPTISTYLAPYPRFS